MRRLKPVWLGCLMIFLFSGIAAADDVLIIANSSVTESAISKTDIQQIFLGKNKKWHDGSKIHLAVLKDGPVHEQFLSTYLNRTPDRYASFWKVAIVSGTGYPPKSFKTEAEMFNYVKETPGAVGYISPATPHDGVNLLTVQ